MSQRPLRILFVMLHAGFVRNYDAALRQLARQGHTIHIVHELDRNKLGENVLLQRLVADCAAVTGSVARRREPGVWTVVVRSLRTFLDFLRYLDPRYAQADRLRDRVEKLVPRSFLRIAGFARLFGQPGVRALRRLTKVLERTVPSSTAIGAFLDAEQPDLILLTPLVDVGSDQPDYVRAARERGIPSALCVASWDNLTNKGLMRVVPDRVFVWNDAQKQEAVSFHDVPAERVTVTGAQIFDSWFEWQPRRDREAFGVRTGLPTDVPGILYLGSSYFIAPNEAEFAQRWIAAIRASTSSRLSQAPILVRPHPNNTVQWLKSDVARLDRVAVWPPFGADPFDPEFKDDFFDSLYHCAVVVGVNTSALIEAAIVGRPVCTVTVQEFAHSQAGTLHFQHLADPDAGLLRVAPTLDAHLRDLEEALTDASAMVARSRAFVGRFVRPHGLDQPATPRLVREIERLADYRPRRTGAAPSDVVIQKWLTRPLAPLIAWCWSKESDSGHPLWWWVVFPFVWLAIRAYVGRLRAAAAFTEWQRARQASAELRRKRASVRGAPPAKRRTPSETLRRIARQAKNVPLGLRRAPAELRKWRKRRSRAAAADRAASARKVTSKPTPVSERPER